MSIDKCVADMIRNGKSVEEAIALCSGELSVASCDDISDQTDYEDDFSGISEAEDKGNKKLNKPFRTPDGPKKFSVYVKNDNGNIVKVNFGDPNMEKIRGMIQNDEKVIEPDTTAIIPDQSGKRIIGVVKCGQILQ